MENFKLNKKFKFLFIFIGLFSIFLLFLNIQKIKCTKFGDILFDKLLGINSNCYERKIKGVIYPSIINKGRYVNLKNKKIVKCPQNSKIILISGQSNSANFLKSFKKYQNEHLNYFNGKCYNLSNPVLGAEGEMSSLIPAIASKINVSQKFIFLTSGWGGMSVAGANSKDFITYNKEALDYLEKKDNILSFFVWIQGESDVGNSNHYYDDFTNMFDEITKDLKSKNNINLIITQTSRCFSKIDPNLRKVQKKISLERDKSIEVINTDKLGNNYRYDDCHYNELGIKILSDQIANVINKIKK